MIHLMLSLVFVLFAAVQYNDPDPLVWIAIYMSVAVVCGMAYKKKHYPAFALAVLGAISLYWLTYLPDFMQWLQQGMPSIVTSMKAETPFVELVREFLGLTLAILTLGFEFSYMKAQQKA